MNATSRRAPRATDDGAALTPAASPGHRMPSTRDPSDDGACRIDDRKPSSPHHIRSDSASRRFVEADDRVAVCRSRLDRVMRPGQRQKPERPLRRSDQSFDELLRRPGQQFGGRAILQKSRIVHHGDPVAKMERLFHIVRHQHDGGAETALDRQKIFLRLARG